MELITTHRLRCPQFSLDAERALSNLLSQCALTALERGDNTMLDCVRSVMRCFEFYHLIDPTIRKTVALCQSCLDTLTTEQRDALEEEYRFLRYPLSVRHAYEEFYESGTLYMVNVCNPHIGGFNINYCYTLYRLFNILYWLGFRLFNGAEDASNLPDSVRDTLMIATKYNDQLQLMDHELDENKDA